MRDTKGMDPLNRIDRISEELNRAVKYVAALLTTAMTVLVFLQVLFRYVLNSPLDWSEELSSFAFVWMALLGASIGLRGNLHPRLDIFFDRFPHGLQKIVMVLINLSIIFMLVVLFYFGLQLTISMRMQRTAALGYSVSFVYLVLPISALIMLVHVSVQTMLVFRKETRREQNR